MSCGEALESRRYFSTQPVNELPAATRSSLPFGFVDFNGEAVFVHDTAGSEAGISATDGTAAGTRLITTEADGTALDLTLVNGALYYRNNTSLRRIDNAASGASTVAAFDRVYGGTAGNKGLVAFNGRIYFIASTASTGGGIELFSSDGTSAGSGVVRDVNPGNGSSTPQWLTDGGDWLYFTADDGVNGRSLWRTDGTSAGTTLVRDIRPGTTNPSIENLTRVGSTIYFTANDGVNGTELWRSDGTAAGTSLVADLTPGSGSFSPGNLTAVGNTLYFTNSGNTQLWRTDGTAAGTHQVRAFTTLTSLTAFGDAVYFAVGGTTEPGLWRSDGTFAGTVRLAELTSANTLSVTGGALYFRGTTAAAGAELWMSDGTAGGTRQVADIAPGTASSSPDLATAVAGRVFFAANDNVRGKEPWVTDGTAAGTRLVSDLNMVSAFGSAPDQTARFRGQTIYSAQFAPLTWGVFRTDGTTAGTVLLTQSPAASNGTFVNMNPFSRFQVVGDRLLFTRGVGTTNQLVSSDGTPAGTTDVGAPFSHTVDLQDSAVLNGFLYFRHFDATNGIELWRTNGTAAGTALFASLVPGAESSTPENLTTVGSQLFFFATNSSTGTELWRTDGTTAGTQFVRDIRPGTASSAMTSDADATRIVGLDGVAYFFADDGISGRELWRSDGTTAGTTMVWESIPGASSVLDSYLTELTAIPAGTGKGLYFVGLPLSGAGYALFRSTGTAAGTSQVRVLKTSSSNGPPERLTAVGNLLFLSVAERISEPFYRLWRSDGTAGGTFVARSFQVDQFAYDRSITAIVDVGGVAYVSAQDVIDGAGRELWRSDGTVAGTFRVTDIAPGATSSLSTTIGSPVGQDGLVLFGATAGLGMQLWRYAPTPLVSTIPAAATALSATVVNGVRINLAWTDNAVGEVGYRVERSTSPTFATLDGVSYHPADTVAVADTGLREGTTYHYRVFAYTSAGDAVSAPSASATTTFTPPSPTGLTAVAAVAPPDVGRRVDLAWIDNASNEVSYRLERSFSPQFTSIDRTWTLPVNTASFADTTVPRLATVYYRLVGVNASGDSAVPAVASVAVPDTVPAAPSGLIAWGISDTAIQLQWVDNADNEQAYDIERSENGGPFVALASSVRAGHIDAGTLPGVLPGNTYSYRVRARNASGSSSYSNEASAVPLLPQLSGLVRDVNDDVLNAPANPSSVVMSGGVGIIAANDGTGGRELWRTDGTTAGTSRVADVWRGSSSSSPIGLTDVGGTLYFFTTNGPQTGLWATDGTESGTRFVSPASGSTTVQSVAVNGKLVFVNTTAAGGTELWASDGTAAGTLQLADLAPGPFSSNPTSLTVMNGAVYFLATTAGLGTELYRTDGTSVGTTLVGEIIQGTVGTPTILGATPNGLLLRVPSAATGDEVWRSDGTAAGTGPLMDIRPGATGSNPRYAAVVGGRVFFAANNDAGLGLWVSDGTVAGTYNAKSLPAAVDRSWWTTDVGGVAYFILTPSAGTQTFVYRSDGTDAGTLQVSAISSTVAQPAVTAATAAGGRYFFVAPRTASWTDVWQSDGTAAGTFAVTTDFTINPDPQVLSALGTSAAFSATGSVGRELWSSDGTVAGTKMVADIWYQTAGANPQRLVTADGLIYFPATGPGGTPGLYRTDGTSAGTTLVASVGSVSAVAEGPGATVVFATFDSSVARLWSAAAMPGQAVQLHPALPTTVAVEEFWSADSLVFFRTRNADGSMRLWRTDGTVAGTLELAGVNPVSVNAAGRATRPVVLNNVLYFAGVGTTSSSGIELWRSDGTIAGTQIVRDLELGAGSSGPFDLTVMGQRVYFAALTTGGGWALWRTDGTVGGTFQVLGGFTEGSSAPGLGNLAAVGNAIYFSAADPNFGLQELWRSDGTTAGTAIVADLDPGFTGSNPRQITDVGGVAYFLATDTARGLGLWRSDGTAAGTVRLKDVSATGGTYIVDGGGTAFFAEGSFLWKTDGTVTGTVRQMPIGTIPAAMPGVALAAVTGDRLIFAATVGVYGRELYGVSLAVPTAPLMVRAVTTGSTGALVSWNDTAVNESGYVVERLPPTSTGSSTPERVFYLSADATAFTDTSATGPGVRYRVAAYNAAGVAAGQVATATQLTAPVVETVAVNGGGRQRSMVRSVVVTFDQPVSLESDAIRLVGRNGVAAGATVSRNNPSADGRTWVLTFSGTGIVGGSLPDGVYDLTVVGSRVRAGSPSGPAMSADTAAKFHRLFSDNDGDGDSDNLDLFAIRATINRTQSDPAFNAAFDFDSDGDVDNADLFQVRNRRTVVFLNY